MNSETMPPEGKMMKFILGKWISKPIHLAAELGLADILDQGSLGIEALAQRTGTDSQALYRLMRALAAVDIFMETDPRIFSNTAMSECLMTDRLRSAALMFHAD